MIVQQDAHVTHIHVTAHEAAELESAIVKARPRGSVATASGAIMVHVHADAAPAKDAHKAVAP